MQVLKGLYFNTTHSDENLPTDFATPYFRNTTVYESSNGDIPQCNNLVQMRSQMSNYPESHKLRIEYQTQDVKQDLLATIKEH